MLKRYSIWDKKSSVITPSGEVFDASSWKARYPVATIPEMTIVGSAGPVNGGFFGVLEQMVIQYESIGADFSAAKTNEEKLEMIEAFEDQMNMVEDTGESTPEERIAAALELQNLLMMPDENMEEL